MTAGIVELDVHGMTCVQCRVAVDAKLRRARGDVYRIRVIHGYHGGTALRDMLRSEYRNHPKVRRIEFGFNAGETDLVLREF